MHYKAIIFDLYGTLVGNFSRQAYDQIQAQMANILDVPFSKFWQIKVATIKDRSLGNLSVEENIAEVGRRLNVKVDTTQIEEIVALENEFTKTSLIPEPEVLEVLDRLKHTGFLLGLITNCNTSVPQFFQQSELAQHIHVPVFSCKEGLKKPSSRIYEIACERLIVETHECLYVGDGSNEELKGAASVGMQPILKRTDLSDVYDPKRQDVENWDGIVINEISELCCIVSELTL